MYANTKQTDSCQTKLLSLTSKSKKEFIKEYKKYDETSAKELYIQVLIEFAKTISEGNIDTFKKLSNLFEYIISVENQAVLKDYYDNTDHPIKRTNLVILACQHNKEEILKYLFDNNSKILDNLSIDIGKNTVLPDDEDEEYHNAFYYAIRSGNLDLLDKLTSKWPGNYFDNHLEKLDEIISKAYEELKLKNVLLSEEIEIFVEKKLINLRFFSYTLKQGQTVKDNLHNIRERIELVLQSICLLKAEYLNAKEIDEKFLFIAKFIAQNIHVLKRQLKSTYGRLPWEEIEFCLVKFVFSHTKRQEINLFYHIILNKNKILNYLENFAKKLENEKDDLKGVNIDELADLPKLKRGKIVAEIIRNYPKFEELYNDYQQIRDIHSLEKINDYIKLALSANPKEREGQLIIVRVLQVIGEYLKNTLESPKLSSTTSELLLLSLPKNTRKVIIDLRNSLSHAYSLSKRTEIEENADVNFFIGVQNDTKKIGDVISNILYNNKIKTVRILLKKISNCESLDKIKEVTEAFNNAKLDVVDIGTSEKFLTLEHEKLEKLIAELTNSITEKTSHEKELFNKISNIIKCAGTRSENIRTNYITAFAILKSLSILLGANGMNHNDIKGIKFRASKSLESIVPQIKSHSLKEIAELIMKISHSVKPRIHGDELDEVNRLVYEIFYIVEFGTGDIKWIEELREKLNEKGSFIPTYKQKKALNITEEKYNNQLILKLSELKSILRNNELSGKLIEKLPFYRSNKKLQAVVEMLVLDIMSILGSSKNYLEHNLLFLDDNTPLLTGKCLRNHLAHDNALLDVLLSDPSIAVILNAEKLTSENIMKSKKKVGKLVRDDPFKLKYKYDQDLITITNQERMFVALKEGNLEDLKGCLKKGADINARSINSWTALHFAAMGPSLEIIKFILNQNLDVNVKNTNGQNPLHIASAYGRDDIVKCFVEVGLYVDDIDNHGKTPLHIAAENGHKDTVEVLLKNKANTIAQDIGGISPLYYAIRNNNVDVAKVLLKKDINVDINQAAGGFTPLHEAAESGHLELVNFLLQNKADVNTRNDRYWTPLHAAAYNGYPEIVNVLITKGANVNASVINGCTSLHYAIENGHEEIVNILLEHGANVNAVDKTYNNTPLHYAAKYGHEGIVIALLKNKANARITTFKDMTPLHLAAQSGHLKIAIVLLKHGVNIHAKDKNNATPLFYAAESGHKEVVELLIKNRAQINTRDNNNYTPLHIAALRGHTDIIDLLIRNKAGVNNRDIKGGTPVHAAAMSGSKDVIDFLIKNKAEVDARTHDGFTPLHIAALNGRGDVIVFLIKNKAEVNAKANYGVTPLHSAVLGGHIDVVNILIKNKAEVNVEGIENGTPLHLAVEAGHKEIVEILVANGANVNVKSDSLTPLLSAIKCNNIEIVEVLIANDANVNADGGAPLSVAVLAGYRDIVEILLKNKADINMKFHEDATLLHLAASRGHKEIVNALITRGANVDAITINGTTPLFFAAQEGHDEIAGILIANKANVNFANDEGAALHIAAVRGNDNVVEILLNNGAKINLRDNYNRISLELAVSHGHLKVVKMLLQYKKVDMNAKGNDDYTILHIASQESNLEMVKYLVDEGSNIHAKNAFGSKPINIAAREGHKNTIEFFLNKGLSIDELGTANQTLLHYAAIQGHLKVVKYLIAQGADVNAKDTNRLTPMHIAAYFGYKDVIEVLLKSGAVYNAVDKYNKSPLEITKDKNVINLLTSTKKLFEAAWKGYHGVVNVLLQNKADPNVVGNKGVTPLHYAAKFSHYKVVMTLLSNGAVYNAVCDSGKTPLDFVENENIARIFKLVSESFKNVKNGNDKVINDLNKINDTDAVKAVMNSRDKENKTLVVAAMHSNFSKTEQLKQISQGDVSAQISIAETFLSQGNYQRALSIFKSIFEKRKEILGPDNPGTLDIQTYMGRVIYTQGFYQEALYTFEEVFQKQKGILGLNDKDTLVTRNMIALILHRQEKNEEAIYIYREVYLKQKELLGPNHSDTLDTQFHMALVLDAQGEYKEALQINTEIFEKVKEISGANDPFAIRAQNNMALVLANQGKYEEALKIYKEVFKKKKLIFGINHCDTLRTLHSIAGVLCNQKKYNESLIAHQDVLNLQKNALGTNHPDTLSTQYNMANVLFLQHKWIGALKAYKEAFDQMKAVFGPIHPSVLDISKKIETINFIFKIEGHDASEIIQHLQKEINIAVNNGDLQIVQSLLNSGTDANDKDIDEKTPLHYAANNGQIGVVNILLKNGADVAQVTNKGNTPLHIATSKGYKEIVEVLLQHIDHNKLNDFINAKTTASGTTSLHVAAKNGSLEIIIYLLKRGAIYNIKNNEGKTPLDLSKDQKVTNLLKLIEDLFRDTKNGNVEVIRKLRVVRPNEFVAVTNARNNQGNTLLQVAIANGHKNVASKLLEILKKPD